MIGSGTAFSTHQIVLPIDIVEMRAFNPYGFLIDIDTTVNNYFRFSRHTVVFPVKVVNTNGSVSAVEFFTLRTIIVYNIGLAVFVKKNTRVYATYLWKPYRVTPDTFFRILGLYIEIATITYMSSNHIESFVLRIIGNIGSIYSRRYIQTVRQT